MLRFPIPLNICVIMRYTRGLFFVVFFFAVVLGFSDEVFHQPGVVGLPGVLGIGVVGLLVVGVGVLGIELVMLYRGAGVGSSFRPT